MPGMADPNFSTTVTLICEHNDDGALGIIINRPLTLNLSGLFEQLSVDDADPHSADTWPPAALVRVHGDSIKQGSHVTIMARGSKVGKWLSPGEFAFGYALGSHCR